MPTATLSLFGFRHAHRTRKHGCKRSGQLDYSTLPTVQNKTQPATALHSHQLHYLSQTTSPSLSSSSGARAEQIQQHLLTSCTPILNSVGPCGPKSLRSIRILNLNSQTSPLYPEFGRPVRLKVSLRHSNSEF